MVSTTEKIVVTALVSFHLITIFVPTGSLHAVEFILEAASFSN